MKNKFLKTAAITGGTAALMLGLPATAHAAERCEGSTYSGRCVEVTYSNETSTVVENIPVENAHSVDTEFNCAFTQSQTQTMSSGVSLSSSVSASVVALASVEVSGTLSQTLTQSATQATTAGGTFTLSPGQTANCQRTANAVVVNVDVEEWGPGANSYSTTATIPSSFGVRVAS